MNSDPVQDILAMADEQTLALSDVAIALSISAAEAARAFSEVAAVFEPTFHWFPDPNNPRHREAIRWLNEQEFEYRYTVFMARRARKRKHRRP